MPIHATRRLLFPLSALLVCLASAGCANVVRQYTEPAPILLSPAPTLGDVVSAVNSNSQQVHSLRTTHAKIGLAGAPSLTAAIALARDRRFRLTGENALIGPAVDLGSNDELLWLWIRGIHPPAMFYCRHDRFGNSAVARRIPVHPRWLIDAFGLTTFGAGDRHTGPFAAGEGRIELRSDVATPAGRMTKVTIVDNRRAWVLEQHLFDADGQHVAAALTSNHQRDPLSGATLPRHVEIQWPRQDLRLTIDMDEVQVNYLGDHPEALWAMPEYEGSALVDLSDPRLRLPSLVPAVDSTITEPATSRPTSFIIPPHELLRRLLPK